MKNWNTTEIKQKIETAIAAAQVRISGLIQPSGIEVHPPGGDHDTEYIRVMFGDSDEAEWIEVYGFDEENDIDWESQCSFNEVTQSINFSEAGDIPVARLVVHTSPGYQPGGIQSDDEAVCLIAQAIKSALKRDGWEVVDSMDDYF